MVFRIQLFYRTSAFIRVEYISIQPYMFLSQTGDTHHPEHLYILQDHLHDIMTFHNGTAVPVWLSETLCQQPADMNH